MITSENISAILQIINDIHQEWQICPAMILTESDLQCIIFSKLNSHPSFGGNFPTKEEYILGRKIHSEVSWFNENNTKLRYRTDISIIEPSQLSIIKGIGVNLLKMPSKGFSFGGQAIIFEIKLNRASGIISTKLQNDLKKDKRTLIEILNKFREAGDDQQVYAFHIFFDATLYNNEQQYFEIIGDELQANDRIRCIYKRRGPLPSS